MRRYWSIITVGVGVIVSYAVGQERTAENARRTQENVARIQQVELKMESMATKADLKRVEDGVTFLVQREITKAGK